MWNCHQAGHTTTPAAQQKIAQNSVLRCSHAAKHCAFCMHADESLCTVHVELVLLHERVLFAQHASTRQLLNSSQEKRHRPSIHQ
jgi:hypothetical protein